MSIEITFIPKAERHSQYDWADISFEGVPVGKARCMQDGAVFTIFSINIYPEWAGHGYGREFVDDCKIHYDVIIADRVRQTAIGFWEAVGFHDNADGNWIYRRTDAA